MILTYLSRVVVLRDGRNLPEDLELAEALTKSDEDRAGYLKTMEEYKRPARQAPIEELRYRRTFKA